MKTARKNKYTLDTTGQAWIYQDGFMWLQMRRVQMGVKITVRGVTSMFVWKEIFLKTNLKKIIYLF